MRILTYPCSMEIGGSQLNAVELAARMAERGHDVVMFGPDGELVPMVRGLGLEYVVAERPDSWPVPRNGAQLRRLVASRSVDVVHGYEWGPALDLAFGVEAHGRAVAVTTVLSMSVPSVVPRHSPLVVGTAELLASESGRPGATYLMEPPIDTERNAPRDTRAARARFGIPEEDVLCLVACRLSGDLGKLPGVLAAVDVVGGLVETGLRVHLLVVGDGEGRLEVDRRAAALNTRAGRRVVTTTGGLIDPTDAYAAADIVLGMGSSLMKGLAFGKPAVVQGDAGFWRLLDEHSQAGFLRTGWFGHGGAGRDDLLPALRCLVVDPALRARLGALGRALVVERFSLASAVGRLEAVYESALEDRPARGRVLAELTRCAREVAKFETVQLSRRLRGTLERPSASVALAGGAR